MKRLSDSNSNRRRFLAETSLSSVLLRAALVAGGASALFVPQAAAQGACTIVADVQTCSGAPTGGRVVTSTVSSPRNTLTIRNMNGPILPLVGSGNESGISLTRDLNTAKDLTLNLDASVNLSVTETSIAAIDVPDLVGKGAIIASDQRSAASPAGQTPDVVINTAATVTYDSNFTAPSRETFLNLGGQIGKIQGDIAKIDAALALPALDSLIEAGFSFSDRFFWFGLDVTLPWGGAVPNADAQTILRANCVVRPGFEGSTNSLGAAFAFFGNLCWFVPPPENPEIFRREADQYKELGLDRIDYLTAPPRPEEFLTRNSLGEWRGAVYARAQGNGVVSGDARITNSGAITTTGDFAAGIVSVSQSRGEVIGAGGAYVVNTGAILTHDDSSGGILAISLGAQTGGENVPGHAGVVEVTGSGAITTEGLGSHGILAYSLGGGNTADGGDFPAGNGGDVTVRYSGDIVTREFEAVGVLAQSKGGWGGSGNNAGVSDSAEAGGVGGDGKTVTVEILADGSVNTKGRGAHALSAASIGGDGGEGGSGNDVRSASRGGWGGNGGAVSVVNRGYLHTEGRDAYGIIATSFAGAGGLGGDGDSVFRGRGAHGGEAGDAGNVTVDNYGLVWTQAKGAFGVFAQSVGGVAGNGGGSTGAFSSNAGSGGTRESGRCNDDDICGDGGIVTVTNAATGRVFTDGDYAYAVFAQSIGGGGGVGGDAGGWFSVSGGDGGNAGFGSDVIIDNGGLLQTSGNRSSGIFAQSIGGGGGSGGDASGGGQNVSIQIGGDGGAGGNGGNVTITNQSGGVIITSGERSDGVFAQSIGGGGGTGGDATAIVVGGFAVPIAIGGEGGIGGDAGAKVKIDNRGRIDTGGDFSNGIFAQSIGGGGGVGGSSYAFGAAISDIVTFSSAIAIGGDGGAAGDAKSVEIDNSGSVVTRDFNANGIVGQSIGGGGGAGGSSVARSLAVNVRKGAAVAFSLAIGGDGGAGGDGGLVDIENTGGVFTFGDGSAGVLAQSVGGGGGLGGDASAASQTIAGGNSSEVKVSISIGGDGGAAGQGGDVKVVNRGQVVTLGDISNGITAQSVGGGGGYGGAGAQGDLFDDLGIPDMAELPESEEEDDATKSDRQNTRTRYRNLQGAARSNPTTADSIGRTSKSGAKGGKSGSVNVNLAMGGHGSAAGDGALVDVKNYGEIITGGFMSMGVFAQSVGGGGGFGAGGEANSSGDISLGGGLGGGGGSAGNGGEVLVLNQGDITTLGELAFGIFAQSVGGGGGAGGLGTGDADEKYNVQLNIGGDGGQGGTGGHVRVDQTGDVMTLGKDAIGVFAQSIGGGGGVAGSADQGSFASISIGGNGGTGGGSFTQPEMDHAGKVEVYVAGDITTEGDHAHGVSAQSIGGGGGMALGVSTGTYVETIDAFGGIPIDTGLTIGVGNYSDGGSGGVGGNGGEVIVGTSGLITTIGKGAYGIIAQSVGGGGGMGGSAGETFPAAIGIAGSTGDQGTAGKITVTHTGSIHAYGEGSVGIWAQSMAGSSAPPSLGTDTFNGRGENIEITLNNGEIIGGSGASGAGIFVSGGKTNTITNRGGRISALSDNAIIGTDGDETILNSGLIRGNIGLGGGANAFNNQAAGRFESGAAIWLGQGATLTNAGVIAPFGDEARGTTRMTGNFVQTAQGTLRMNMDFNGAASDRLDITGTASLAGKITPVVGHVASLKAGVFNTVLTTTTLTNNGISIDHADTLAIDYGVRFQGAAMQIGINSIDFDIAGLASGQSALANHIQDIWAAGTPGDLNAMLDALAYGTDANAYKTLLDSIHPHDAFTQGARPVQSAQANLTGLQSCPEGASSINPLHETACTWVRSSFSHATQDPNAGDPGYRDNVARLQAGQQFELGGDWFAGYAIGYEKGSFNVGNDVVGTSDTGHIGGVVKRDSGPLLLSGAIDASYGVAERRRRTGFPTVMTAESDNDTLQLSARARAAWLIQAGDWYLRPALDLDGYHVRTSGFTESGAGAFNMVMADSDQTFGAGTLSLASGVTAQWGGALWHPYAELNATGLTTDAIDLTGRLQGAAPGVADFTVSSALPQTLYGARLGLEAFFPYGSMRFELEQREGNGGYSTQSGSLKVRFGF